MNNRPKIGGLSDINEILEKAGRDLERYRHASSINDRKDAAHNFAMTIVNVAEWHWEMTLKNHPSWHHLRYGQYLNVLQTMAPSLGHLYTHGQAAKHVVINKFSPSFQTLTAVPTTREAPFSSPGQARVAGADNAEATEIVFTAHIIGMDGVPEYWEPHAEAALRFWLSFNPDKGPGIT